MKCKDSIFENDETNIKQTLLAAYESQKSSDIGKFIFKYVPKTRKVFRNAGKK